MGLSTDIETAKGYIPNLPKKVYETDGFAPSIWFGADAVDGAAPPWANAPIGSLYILKADESTAVTWYLKSAVAGATADWTVISSTAQRKGFINVPLTSLRELTTSAIPNAAGNGGLLASDTTPILNTINGDTDSCLRLNWAAANVDAVGFQVTLPDDVDEANPILVKFRAAMAATNDTPLISADTFFNEGDTKVEDDSAAVTGTSYATYTITIAAADVPSGARTMNVELTPAAHGTDALYITAVWVEYTRI